MAATTGSGGTGDTRVDRPDEGLPGIATKKTEAGWPENPTANPPSRASFDTAKATGIKPLKVTGTIDTTWTQGGTTDAEVNKRS